MRNLHLTLDLIFTQLHGEVKVTNATTHGYISNHCMVSIDLQLHKLRYPKVKKTIRDKTRFTAKALLTNFTAPTLDTNDSLDQTCHKLNTELHNTLEKTAPLKQSHTQTSLDNCGSTNTSEANKNSKIKTEVMRHIQASSLDGIYQRKKYIQLTNGIQQTISKKILDCGRDYKQLFSVVNSLTNNR